MTGVLPGEFTGGWRRVSITVGDGEPHEDMSVWWLQSATHHADLRVPLVPGSPAEQDILSFAGTTTWDGAWLTWTPALTLVPSDRPDTGLVSWDDGDLLEAGSFEVDGAEVPYLERWRRIPGTDGTLLALSCPYGRLVQTGSHALTVLDRRAQGGAYEVVAWRLVGSTWTVDHTYPDGAKAPAPPLLVSGPTLHLDDGSLWSVDEYLPATAASEMRDTRA